MTGATAPSGDSHRTSTRKAADVPQSIAWAKVGDHWKPVVRIEITGSDQQREMTSFGPGHEFLATTTARLSAPAPSQPQPTLVPTLTPPSLTNK